MSRYHRAKTDNNLIFALIVLVGVASWTHRELLIHIALIAGIIMACSLTLYLIWKSMRHCRSSSNRDINTMNGLEFEYYVAELLRRNDYRNISLTERYDLGVDIIAEKDGIRWGIQVKRYSGLVKAAAVRQVVTGLRMYDCDRAMVITNGRYSTVARRLADGNDCILVDGLGLDRLRSKYNRGAIL